MEIKRENDAFLVKDWFNSEPAFRKKLFRGEKKVGNKMNKKILERFGLTEEDLQDSR